MGGGGGRFDLKEKKVCDIVSVFAKKNIHEIYVLHIVMQSYGGNFLIL